MPLIEVQGVTHRYPTGESDRVVLQGISARLEERRIGVIGANGSGKSTFARLLNGLVVPSEGTVTIDGLNTARQAREVRRKVGFVFTDPDSQIVMPTVVEDLGFGLRRLKLDRAEQAERVDRILARLGLTEHRDHPAHLLSGGQKQLLAFGSVLITEPELIVLDEPTTLLDLANTQRIRALVASLEQQVVLVSHDLELMKEMERVLVFDQARLVFDGPPDAAVAHYRGVVAERSP